VNKGDLLLSEGENYREGKRRRGMGRQARRGKGEREDNDPFNYP